MKNLTTMKIPAKYTAALELVERDTDGYWAYTNRGWRFTTTTSHTAANDTQAQLMRDIRSIEPCDCLDCLTHGEWFAAE
jgi:hypothetical protein